MCFGGGCLCRLSLGGRKYLHRKQSAIGLSPVLVLVLIHSTRSWKVLGLKAIKEKKTRSAGLNEGFDSYRARVVCCVRRSVTASYQQASLKPPRGKTTTTTEWTSLSAVHLFLSDIQGRKTRAILSGRRGRQRERTRSMRERDSRHLPLLEGISCLRLEALARHRAK